jgi:uncharacterized protein (TIGR01777 family)
MRILISGSNGLIGSALRPALQADGHEIIAMGRGQTTGMEGAGGVVHLAGENIAEGRWTEPKKTRIRDSRVRGTQALVAALAATAHPPKILVCASAIGCYGDRGDEILTETSVLGGDFLAGVCRDWEGATAPAMERGIRVVNLRFGIVLSRTGGALAKMLPMFRVGLGGRVGSGNQWWSWIAIDDAVAAIRHVISNDSFHGPVNVVSPQPVTNGEFTRVLGHVLGRPTLFPLPAFAARLMLGEMADALLLSSTRVEPRRLLESGFQFRNQKLESALRALLDRAA